MLTDGYDPYLGMLYVWRTPRSNNFLLIEGNHRLSALIVARELVKGTAFSDIKWPQHMVELTADDYNNLLVFKNDLQRPVELEDLPAEVPTVVFSKSADFTVILEWAYSMDCSVASPFDS